MWHEARKQEKKIRSLMVDYKKRADRRREFYQKIKLDPAQFLRIYGRPTKIHWEQSVAVAAESPQSMMPWQGDSSIKIDRFDGRAHLDYIPATVNTEEPEMTLSDEEEERNANYERYRILVQNECAGVGEEQCLQQIYVDEMYGGQEVKVKDKERQEEKAKLAEKKAAIGFKYEEAETEEKNEENSDAESEESIDSDMDLDAVFDVDKLTTEQTQALNQLSVIYGMKGDDYIKCLWKDKDEAEELRLAKMMEEEKAQFSGRKSRRERRAYKEKKLRERGSLSPPSYAKRDSPKYEPYKKSGRSPSRSVSPVVRSKKKFITSFGGSDDEAVVQGPVLPPHLLNKSEKAKSRKSKSPPMFKEIGPSVAKFHAVSKKHGSSSSSRSPSPKSRTRRRSRSRSRSYSRYSTYRRSRWSGRRSRSSSRSRGYSRRSRSPHSRSHRYRRSSSRPRTSRSYRSRSQSRRSLSRRSRSRKSSYRSRSSHSRSSSSSSSERSASKSPEKVVEAPAVFRRRSITPSSSELSLSEDENASSPAQTKLSTQQDTVKRDGITNKSRLSIQDRMKKKMQKVLNQQYKADKQARQEKREKEDMERLEREEELRLIAIDLRRKEREKRHQEQLEMERMEQEERKREEQRRKDREMERRSNGSKNRRSRSPGQSKKSVSKSSERSKSPSRKSQGAESKSYSSSSTSKRSRSKERRSRSQERGSKYRGSESKSSAKVPKLVDY